VNSLGISKSYSTDRPVARRLRLGLSLPRSEAVLGGGVTALVGLLVLPPLVAVVLAGADADFVPARHPDIVLNTLVFGLAATVGALAVGTALALALAPGIPGGALLERLVTMPLYLTPLLTAMGWSWLGSPKSGLLNVALHAVFGLGVTLNMISAGGAIAVTALAAAPLPFLLVSDARRALDPALLEAARVHGARPLLVFRRIVLPLLLPALAAASVLVFVQSIGMFSVPAVLGMPAGFHVATTQIYSLLETYPPRVGDATAWGLMLLAVAVTLIVAQAALLGRRSFVTITGKTSRPAPQLPQAPRLRAAVAWVYVTVATALPLLTLLWAASCRFITADFGRMQFSAEHFSYVLFAYPKTWLAVRNSCLLAVLTATLVALFGLAVAWVVLRSRQRGRALLDQLSMVPLGMPAMVFALGLLWVYVAVPLPIYGTLGILLIAYVTHFLPFGVRTAGAALHQLHPELEEAARVAGASWLRTMRRIVFPLVQPAALAAWVLLFVMAMQEVSSSILLYTSHSLVLSVAMFDLWENGNPSDVAALGCLQLGVSCAVIGIVLGLRRRSRLA
jgi:iron(III) transport system permease protein